MRLPTPGCQGRGAPAGQDDGRRHDRPRDRTKRVAGQVYAYSAASRTLIPPQAEHWFRCKPNTDSGASRTPIPPASRTLSGPCSGIA